MWTSIFRDTYSIFLDSLYNQAVLDLMAPKKIGEIIFAPRNNLNHVIKGHEYEFFYLDNGIFKSLGQKKALDFFVGFDEVPTDMLLYLKCLDEGVQEQLFEYKNGTRIFY